MTSSGHFLIINPGSTSTKLAVYYFNLNHKSIRLIKKASLDHPDTPLGQIDTNETVSEMRTGAVRQFVTTGQFKPDYIMARGAPLRPLEGGVYEVNTAMLSDINSARYSQHASNLGALIGYGLGSEWNIPVYIADPISTDEFELVARISGVPGIERKSRSHALNIKASLHKQCALLDLNFSNSSWVVCHMGGGISVAALKNGRIIDVNDALLGMGPFSPERAGGLPIAGLLDLVFQGGKNRDEIETLLSHNSGLKGYLGTGDLRKVEELVASGDTNAKLILNAMVYQIAKEIGAMASVLSFQLNGVLLTGGMAHSRLLCQSISERIQGVAKIYIQPGENELEALAEAGLRVLLGIEPIKMYKQANQI
ncbi:MAG: butyrate kinase [Candidatus Marinimicrobia bacterium]|nr:butyrate kinase [Candidatus Neomarinimicrobiota bacterium]